MKNDLQKCLDALTSAGALQHPHASTSGELRYRVGNSDLWTRLLLRGASAALALLPLGLLADRLHVLVVRLHRAQLALAHEHLSVEC